MKWNSSFNPHLTLIYVSIEYEYLDKKNISTHIVCELKIMLDRKYDYHHQNRRCEMLLVEWHPLVCHLTSRLRKDFLFLYDRFYAFK